MSFQYVDITYWGGYLYLPALAPRAFGVYLLQLPPKTVSELLANWHAGDDEALRAALPSGLQRAAVSRIVTSSGAPATLCKARLWCTRLICDWRSKALHRSRIGSIS